MCQFYEEMEKFALDKFLEKRSTVCSLRHQCAAPRGGQSYLDPNNGGIELKVTLCIGYSSLCRWKQRFTAAVLYTEPLDCRGGTLAAHCLGHTVLASKLQQRSASKCSSWHPAQY